jgi:hypothetical protein
LISPQIKCELKHSDIGDMNATHPVPAEERRRSPRSSHVIEGWLSPHNSPEREKVTNIDMSQHGVGFDATLPVAVGEQHIYEMGGGDQSLVCDLRIVNCRETGKKAWHVGAEFI